MSIPPGKKEYEIENDKIVAFGVSHTEDEMLDALCSSVYERICDLNGCEEIVGGLQDTGFDSAVIMQKLFPYVNRQAWEIGEAYAQSYAEENLSACIPWGISRDIKKPGSSLPGADIVGLYRDAESTYFLFGEVKTSSDRNVPPGVMYGETGLKKQLEDFCTDKNLVRQLVVYLAHRLKQDSNLWVGYKEAAIRYFQSEDNIHVLGILVRDIPPDMADLAARASGMECYAVNGRVIELLGIYVPVGRIGDFSRMIREEYERRSASDAEE